MEDVVEGSQYSFPKEARNAPCSSKLHSSSRKFLSHVLAVPQEVKILAFWKEIDAFKQQLKQTEGQPE